MMINISMSRNIHGKEYLNLSPLEFNKDIWAIELIDKQNWTVLGLGGTLDRIAVESLRDYLSYILKDSE